MKTTIHHRLQNNIFILSQQRSMYWEEQGILFIADPHFGQKGSLESDLLRLSDLLYEFKPRKLVVLGDLFHSQSQEDWEYFRIWRSQFEDIRITLMMGVHDTLPQQAYAEMGIRLVPTTASSGLFTYSHKPKAQPMPNEVVISGHVHPGLTLRNKEMEPILLPCFYFGESHIILPSFSLYTPITDIHPEKYDDLYVVTKRQISHIQ